MLYIYKKAVLTTDLITLLSVSPYSGLIYLCSGNGLGMSLPVATCMLLSIGMEQDLDTEEILKEIVHILASSCKILAIAREMSLFLQDSCQKTR